MKTKFKGFWTRNMFLVGLVLILSSGLMYFNWKKPNTFLPQFKQMESDTDKTIEIFGSRYADYLSGNSSDAEFKNALINFQDDLASLNEGLEGLKPG